MQYELDIQIGGPDGDFLWRSGVLATPFMTFNVGHNIDVPGRGSFPVKELHHLFLTQPGHPIGHHLTLVV
jgi:hypothetical protein